MTLNRAILFFFFVLSLGVGLLLQAQKTGSIMKTIESGPMTASWHYAEGRIYLEMSAPTTGWVAVGFNQSDQLSGAYLLMGRVRGQQAEVVEHFTSAPGSYSPLAALGAKPSVSHVEGAEKAGQTYLRFSLPVEPASRYQKPLQKGRNYHLIMAFSRDDDFQHHSTMRTAVLIEL